MYILYICVRVDFLHIEGVLRCFERQREWLETPIQQVPRTHLVICMRACVCVNLFITLLVIRPRISTVLYAFSFSIESI